MILLSALRSIKSNKMKFGIIGFGVMGRIRYNTIKSLQNHSVKKICDPYVNDLPGDVEKVDNYLDVLNDKDIEAVFICVPNYSISKYVKESLDHGKHVFCEKPPGRNSQEILEMVEAEKRNPQLKLMFGFNHRHHDSMIYAKQVIDSGRLGEVLWMRGRYGKSVNDDFSKTWRAKKSLAGGGIFLDQGIHMLDLFLMMVGDFDEVKAYVSNLFWHLDVEDNVFAIFRNKKGQVASLHSTMTQWKHLFSLEIFLEKGNIGINGLLTNSGKYGQEELSIWENRSMGSESWDAEDRRIYSASWNEEERRTYNINSSWENEIKMFINSIENNLPIPVGNSQDAYKLMQLVDKVYEQK